MRHTPLITFTKADDAGLGQREPGDLDYAIHSDLAAWLGNGSVETGSTVDERCRLLAAELRLMADHLEHGTGPMSVSVEVARGRFADRLAERERRAAASPRPR